MAVVCSFRLQLAFLVWLLAASKALRAPVGMGDVSYSWPVQWAEPEGRITLVFSIEFMGTWTKSIARLDLGSSKGLMLPLKGCKIEKCGPCSPYGMIPSCPDGSMPKEWDTSKDRIYGQCPRQSIKLQIGNVNVTLAKPVLVMKSADNGRCEESVVQKAGISHGSPFLSDIYTSTGTSIMTLSLPSMIFGVSSSAPRSALVTTPFFYDGSGGRSLTIIAVNGKSVKKVVTTIDTGNPDFISYEPGSPLSAATRFPFSVTFEGGQTLSFKSAPSVNGKVTTSNPKDKNVLALGFLQRYSVSIDDSNNVVYFS